MDIIALIYATFTVKVISKPLAVFRGLHQWLVMMHDILWCEAANIVDYATI